MMGQVNQVNGLWRKRGKYKEELGQDPGGKKQCTVLEAQKEASVVVANSWTRRIEGESAAEVGRGCVTESSVSPDQCLGCIIE